MNTVLLLLCCAILAGTLSEVQGRKVRVTPHPSSSHLLIGWRLGNGKCICKGRNQNKPTGHHGMHPTGHGPHPSAHPTGHHGHHGPHPTGHHGHHSPHPTGHHGPHPTGHHGHHSPHPTGHHGHHTGHHGPHPTGHHGPYPTGHHGPHPTGHHGPHPTGHHGPHPTGHHGPHPTGHHGPYPTGHHGPYPTGHHGPHPTGHHGPHPTGHHGPHPTGHHGPHPTGHHGPHPTGHHGPHPTGHHGPHPTGNHGPYPTGHHGPHPTGHHGLHPTGHHGPHPTGHHGPHPTGYHSPYPTGHHGHHTGHHGQHTGHHGPHPTGHHGHSTPHHGHHTGHHGPYPTGHHVHPTGQTRRPTTGLYKRCVCQKPRPEKTANIKFRMKKTWNKQLSDPKSADFKKLFTFIMAKIKKVLKKIKRFLDMKFSEGSVVVRFGVAYDVAEDGSIPEDPENALRNAIKNGEMKDMDIYPDSLAVEQSFSGINVSDWKSSDHDCRKGCEHDSKMVQQTRSCAEIDSSCDGIPLSRNVPCQQACPLHHAAIKGFTKASQALLAVGLVVAAVAFIALFVVLFKLKKSNHKYMSTSPSTISIKELMKHDNLDYKC